MTEKIFFFNEQSSWKVANPGKVKAWIKKVFKEERTNLGNLNIILCSDEVLLELNKKYLNRDNYTDIITFPFEEGEVISGDLFISTDRVVENAFKYKNDQDVELLRVIAHGALHLIGYEDNTKEQIKIMRSKEDFYLNLFPIERH